MINLIWVTDCCWMYFGRTVSDVISQPMEPLYLDKYCWVRLPCVARFLVICVMTKVKTIYFSLLTLYEMTGSSSQTPQPCFAQFELNALWILYECIHFHPVTSALWLIVSVFDVQLDFILLHWKLVFWSFYVSLN